MSAALEKNIADTIGVTYEIICIDNSLNRLSIFEAYNIGVAKSIFPLLCFMHDDIEYHSTDWGKLVINHFDDIKTGAIGIAGSPYLPKMPGSWWGGKMVNINYKKDITAAGSDMHSNKFPPTSSNKNKVITLDGVWFCIRKSLFEQIRFDSDLFKGFHFYDVDITAQVYKAGFDLYCVFDIAIRHFSAGQVNENWLSNALLFNKKWRSLLPVSSLKLGFNQKCEAELQTLNELTMIMIVNHVEPKKAYRFAIKELFRYLKVFFYYKTYVHLVRYAIRGI